MSDNNSQYKLLLVDDEPDLLELLVMQFELDGYICFSAKNGQEALDCIEAEQPHLILSDFNMPVMDGEELLRNVKSLYPDILFVMFLSEGGRLSSADALKLGCSAIVEKPFAQKDLADTIKQILSNQSLSHAG